MWGLTHETLLTFCTCGGTLLSGRSRSILWKFGKPGGVVGLALDGKARSSIFVMCMSDLHVRSM
jgi:hypothetical protein